MSVALVYITAGNAEEARRIGRVLVESRLAACANILGPTTAIYRWEGAIQEDNEAVLIVKTRMALVPTLSEKVAALHGYDCPCVVALPIRDGNAAFLKWVEAETAAQ